MKRLLFFITTVVFFVASVAEAAPAQNSRGGGASNKSRTVKKPTKTTQRANTPLAQKSKAQQRREARTRTFGLMPSTLNAHAENVFSAKVAAVKGARDTESALRYLPFVSIINPTGYGNQIDLRGQGRLSSMGVKFQINGIDATPLDSYYSYMPINTVLPILIKEVEVKPGVDAKGGTVNIITSTRGTPIFTVGAGYLNTVGAKSSYNVYALANENINPQLKVNAGVAHNVTGGPREDDEQSSTNALLGAEYKLGVGQSISFDADYFAGKTVSTPLNSFLGSEYILLGNMLGATVGNVNTGVSLPVNLNPEERSLKGLGTVDVSTTRLSGIVGFNSDLDRYTNIDLKAYYSMVKTKFNKHQSYTPYLKVGNLIIIRAISNSVWGNPILNGGNAVRQPNTDDKTQNYVLIDQSDSVFEESKMGIKAKVDYKHPGGILTAGYNGTYEVAKRNPIQHIRGYVGAVERQYDLYLNNLLDISKFTSSFYVKENFQPVSFFSIMAGVQYDMLNYTVESKDEMRIVGDGYGDMSLPSTPRKNNTKPENFLFQVAPVLKFSNTGGIYLRGVTGYNAPPAWAYYKRDTSGVYLGSVGGVSGTPAGLTTITTTPTNLDAETYYTAEVGFKEYIGTRYIPLGVTDFNINALLFSANAFYTQSKNEFYFIGDPYANMDFGTYDKTRRMGVEVALEQYFFGGNLGFNESFTYLKAEKEGLNALGEKEWQSLPYVYDYKATFGVNVDVSALLDKSTSAIIWLQNSLYGNQTVIRKDIAARLEGTVGNQQRRIEFDSSDVEHKLEPYIISDLGVTVGLNKKAIQLTLGIKNVLDTLYYDYYNADLTTTTSESRYLIGRGRTVFLEGQYNY